MVKNFNLSCPNTNNPNHTFQNKKLFASNINSIDWSKLYEENKDANSAYKFFYNKISASFEASFKLVRISRKRMKDKPWITKALKKSSKCKNKLYKKWISTKSIEDEIKYKQYRKTYSNIAKDAESKYYRQMFDERVNSVKQLWRNLNTVCAFKKNKTKYTNIPKIIKNNVELTDKGDISNEFNRYFSTVGQSLVDDLMKNNKDFNDTSYRSFYDNPVVDSMFTNPVSAYELARLIDNLNTSKSAGPDNIGPKIIKEMSSLFIEPLLHIYNLSLSTGKIPDQLKIAKVIPIYKKGDACQTCNYRPISLLSIFDKLLEKIVHKRLLSHLQKHNVLYQYQFGFRKNHSTTLALIDVIDNIYKYLDNNEITIGIYLDLKKAFDTVNHDILLDKMYNYGIRGVVHDWFRSYLSDRQQYTIVNNTESRSMKINCGVPQGSVLGPLLFLIYINDIRNAIPDENIKLYADDTNLFIHGVDRKYVFEKANMYLKLLNKWFLGNKLSLSLDKTCYTVFGLKDDSDCNIQYKGIKINRVPSCRYLGVIIDEKLKWTEHIDYVYNKLIKFVGIFYKLRGKLPSQILKNIYYAFVHPHILYGIELYGNTYPTYLDKLSKLNNKLIRILQNKPIKTPVHEMYKDYNTLPITSLHIQQILLFVYKVKYNSNLMPDLFNDYFITNNSVHNYETRSQSKLHYHSINSSFGSRSLKFKGCCLFNRLPISLQGHMSSSDFKESLYDYIVDNPSELL